MYRLQESALECTEHKKVRLNVQKVRLNVRVQESTLECTEYKKVRVNVQSTGKYA